MGLFSAYGTGEERGESRLLSRTLSATRARAPEIACRSGAPEVLSGAELAQQPPDAVVHQARAGGAPRHRVLCPQVTSNLGEPAGVLSWERDFLLALAVDVLEDFVGNDHEEDEQSGRGEQG